ncbi:MAG: threonylcarbamoyl-AMP synthase [Deltaproteobacteria bacterium]|nr:threonylcarbamoyl-AMP synthase [Deltaproteobacteria bacterium]MBZ0220674.1 threonylcarbamoyl-AMP synthase [Deltaproteobacteria bacterium]
MPERTSIIPSGADYSGAIEVFRAGGVIAYPTETFYGLCVDPFNENAVEALYGLKGRPLSSPIPLIIGDAGMLGSITSDVTPLANKLIQRFWPGPLTLVLKAVPELPPRLTAGTGTVGIRLSGSAHARRLSVTLSSPITSTSANPSGKPPATRPEEALSYFDGSIRMLIDGGALKGEKGSTIVDATGEAPVIIREGEIPSALIIG